MTPDSASRATQTHARPTAEQCLDPSILPRLLCHDPETGKLYWLARTPDLFKCGRWMTAEQRCASWNTQFAGREALTTRDRKGYLHGCIFDRKFKTHRVVYALHEGRWPTNLIDHRDGDPGNNRKLNLREATASENMKNQRMNKHNVTGLKGVSPSGKKWLAQIKLEGKQTYLGTFDCPAAAHFAYVIAADTHHGEFARFA